MYLRGVEGWPAVRQGGRAALWPVTSMCDAYMGASISFAVDTKLLAYVSLDVYNIHYKYLALELRVIT